MSMSESRAVGTDRRRIDVRRSLRKLGDNVLTSLNPLRKWRPGAKDLAKYC
jgi:hypothetical protein